jgi:hypothetical protein
MSVKPPYRQPDSTDKVVRELLKQLPYADPDLRGVPTPSAARRPRPTPAPIMKPKPPGWQRSWGWVTLAVVLGIGLSQWPYTRTCGFSLYAYLAVVILLPVVAVRALVASWIDRILRRGGLAQGPLRARGRDLAVPADALVCRGTAHPRQSAAASGHPRLGEGGPGFDIVPTRRLPGRWQPGHQLVSGTRHRVDSTSSRT